MTIRNLTPDFAVSPQIRAEDIPALAAEGFRAIICNRPDGEEAGQPSAEEIRAAAGRAGLGFDHVPVVSRDFDPAEAEKMAAAFAALPKPARHP